jgi:hypothetical protein
MTSVMAGTAAAYVTDLGDGTVRVLDTAAL